jgi:hypothetical protein
MHDIYVKFFNEDTLPQDVIDVANIYLGAGACFLFKWKICGTEMGRVVVCYPEHNFAIRQREAGRGRFRLVRYTVFFHRHYPRTDTRSRARISRRKNTRVVSAAYTVMLASSLQASSSKIGTFGAGNRERRR